MDNDEIVFDEIEEGMIETPGGGVVILLGEEDAKPSEFYANLALTLPENDLDNLGKTLLDLVLKDKDARKKRDEQQEEGLRRTGLGDDAPGGAQFQGASKVVHPLLTEACVDFSARAMKELFPPEGPAKAFIPGKPDEAKLAKAARKASLMNWQMTVQCPEARAEIEQMLTQLPMGGSQYLKLSWDERRGRPKFLFVPIDDVYLPYAATNFYTAWRKTHAQYLTRQDYEERIASGMYRDADLRPPGMEPEQSASSQANDRIEGRDASSYNEDGLRTVYEIFVTTDAEDDGDAPYIVTVDKPTGKVLAVYRNWAEQDESREELQHFVEFAFVPWRGAYAIGLPHMIGGLSGAATGALRALLDSAHISNSASMLKLKSSMGGQTASIQPGEVVEIEGSPLDGDIRKLAMPLPYNPPSAVLFELLGFLVDAGKRVVQTTLEDIAEHNTEVPVGTTMARLEQGMVVFRSIHGRLHDAMGRMLRILHRMNGLYLSEEALVSEVGERLAARTDFEGPLDVVPVSDPNIFTEAQRYAQVQAIAQRADLKPDLYDARKVEQRVLATLKIPDPEDLLVPSMEPVEENAVRENVLATIGKPLVAMPRQDHIAHLKTHVGYLMSPMFGLSRIMAPAVIPAMLEHVKQHIAMWYQRAVFEIVEQTSGIDVEAERLRLTGDDDRRAFDRMLAEAATVVVEYAPEAFGELPQAIQQAQELLARMQGPGQGVMDPVAAAMAEVQRKTAEDQSDAALEEKALQLKAAVEQGKQQQAQAKIEAARETEELRQRAETEREAMRAETKLAVNAEDNATALELAEMEAEANEKFSVETGSGINPQPNE